MNPTTNLKNNDKANQEKEVFPRFLIVKRVDGDFARVSPFLIEKLLFGLVGELKNIRKTKEGLLVETVSAAQSGKLQSIKKLSDMDVEVTAHKTLNVSKGVIYHRDLLNSSVEEIEENLKSQGVIKVDRIYSRVSGENKGTPAHIVTFDRPSIPEKVKVAFYRLPVRQYIPPPLRCFRCQNFGHTATRCNEEQVCVCGKPIHEGRACEEPLVCVNCSGNHSARSRNCPVFKQEVAIQEVKTKEKLSYYEAKKKVSIQTPSRGISYAKAARGTDIQSLVRDLIPPLVGALKDIFVIIEFKTPQPLSKPPQKTKTNKSILDVDMNIPYATSDAGSEKRKRTDDSRPCSSSEDESSSTSTRSKKKGGWPKGKPRKVST